MPEDLEISPDNYANWFALFHLCQNIKNKKSIHISSIEFGEIIGLSQQTASRRIQTLEELGWIERKIEVKEQIIRITKKGSDIMLNIFKKLKEILENILIVGEVTTGIGEGRYYVSLSGYFNQFQEKLGYEPYKGTLNLRLNDMNYSLLRENLNTRVPVIINGFRDENSERTYGEVHCYMCYVSPLEDRDKKISAAILDIKRTHHKKNIIEILAKEFLRDNFNLSDGDRIIIELIKKEP